MSYLACNKFANIIYQVVLRRVVAKIYSIWNKLSLICWMRYDLSPGFPKLQLRILIDRPTYMKWNDLIRTERLTVLLRTPQYRPSQPLIFMDFNFSWTLLEGSRKEKNILVFSSRSFFGELNIIRLDVSVYFPFFFCLWLTGFQIRHSFVEISCSDVYFFIRNSLKSLIKQIKKIKKKRWSASISPMLFCAEKTKSPTSIIFQV